MSRQNNPGAPKDNAQNSAGEKRQERQADALRENLKRRKEQQRARAAEPAKNEDTNNG